MSDATAGHGPPVLPNDRRAALVEGRLEAVRELLSTHRDAPRAVLLRARRNFAWLTVGGLNHVVLASEMGAVPLLVTRTDAVALAPVNEAARVADEELAGLPIEVEELPWWDEAAAGERARALAGGSDPLPEEALVEEVTGLRELLAPAEHDRLAWLGRAVASAMARVLGTVDAGQPEHAVAAAAVAALGRDGIRTPVVLVAADDRIALYRHPIATDRQVRRRVMLVLVGEAWGLHAALTGFADLEPPDGETRRRMQASAEVLAAMREATRPGATFGDVVAAAAEAYRSAGFADEWRLHHQGGSIGYQGRERIAVPGEASVIRRGMAFAWNPSITGAKAEETFFLDADGRPKVVTPPAPG